MGNQLPSQKGGGARGPSPPIFGPCLVAKRMDGAIKMTLEMEVGLGPVHIVLDGDSSPPQKVDRAPNFWPIFILCPNGCMDQDATWYGGRPRPMQHCVRCGPRYPQKRAHPPLPNFGPCLLWPRSPMSATAELLRNTV